MDTRDVTTGGAGPSNFIRDIIEEDLKAGRRRSVVTRFPPEPNGYAHIGHAQSIWLNFGLAREFGGRCHLRFDDTNPETEDVEYVEAFRRDIRWLGFKWDGEFYASDYFEQLYEWAVQLIRDGKAYVDDLSEEEIRAYRGTVTEPGRPSPYRDRTPEENLDLFERMKNGEFPDGARVLRAKIDMASPNMKMRDPLMYRIRHAEHYRRGDAWCIYPFYDWAHGQSDAIEGITHSICTLEFENNRELYNWFLDHLGIRPRPHQYEFARLNLDYVVMSKRKLLRLVKEGHVAGWDDPRMPTVAAMRRRGITPEAIRAFAQIVGVTRVNSRVDLGLFEYALRDDLNHRAPRVMAVLDPLKVVLTNGPETPETLDADYWPHDVPKEGTRPVPFSRTLYIERDDFREEPPARYKRLAPGRSVRLRHGYVVTCDEVVKDGDGRVVELRCSYDPGTLDANPADGRKVWGVIHWVSAAESLPAEVRLYDRLFRVPNPDAAKGDLTDHLNPDSIQVYPHARVEPSVARDPADTRYQFERLGYFWRDPEDSAEDALVFNRIISLRDTWAKAAGDGAPPKAEPTPAPQRIERRDPTEDLTPDQRERLMRYTKDLDLQLDEAVVLVRSPALANFFEDAYAAHPNAQGVANWIVHELLAVKTPVEALPFGGGALGRLVALIDDGTLTSRLAKEVFEVMLETGDDPRAIVERRGLEVLDDRDALAPMIDDVLAAYPDKVAQYRGGKTGLLGFFIGQIMRQTQGTADPKLVGALVRERLDASG
ncbi:MAG: glutamine--tRNA ligase/YqeY domain fusion protein [Rhodothermales bacterium]|nr:glutamine--tRNA ligase/YqeY domain fusion protein [Rhodothermales bacterium]